VIPRHAFPPALPVPRPLPPARDWTGGDATALRKALRMPQTKFARLLDVSLGSVTHWAKHPATVPCAVAQDALDEMLAAASPEARAKFGQLTAQSAGSAVSVADEGFTAQVVNLGAHPRYAADFRVLACGQVSAARAVLGLPPEEFAAWLGTVLGWTPAGETVGRWEACLDAPPGDVVMAARACLAGAR
jgi:DNA-binding transcriptional regulator YiaG